MCLWFCDFMILWFGHSVIDSVVSSFLYLNMFQSAPNLVYIFLNAIPQDAFFRIFVWGGGAPPAKTDYNCFYIFQNLSFTTSDICWIARLSCFHSLAFPRSFSYYAFSTGASKTDLHYSSRLGRSTIRKIVDECIPAIIEVLKHEINTPSTEQQWESIIEEFYTRWNMPNCFGAVDGKHIFLKAPANMGSHYYNYKNRHSIVLMAVADARMRFTYVDIGCQGRISDGGVWANCSLRRAIEGNELYIPQTSLLPHTHVEAPNFMVADDAFPLSKNLMKPFPGRGLTYDQKIFNYRLSRARRIVENSFGILVAKFRIFISEIYATVERARGYVFACVCLHNFLIGRNAYVGTSELDRENPSSGQPLKAPECVSSSRIMLIISMCWLTRIAWLLRRKRCFGLTRVMWNFLLWLRP